MQVDPDGGGVVAYREAASLVPDLLQQIFSLRAEQSMVSVCVCVCVPGRAFSCSTAAGLWVLCRRGVGTDVSCIRGCDLPQQVDW